jgi:hypothetical protein
MNGGELVKRCKYKNYEEIHAYLEYKIHEELSDDNEDGLYIDLRDYGYEAFEFNVHKKTVNKLRKEIREMKWEV